MEKITGGLIAIGILALLQGCAWYFQINGAFTSSVSTIIGLISGAIFGYGIAKKEGGNNTVHKT